MKTPPYKKNPLYPYKLYHQDILVSPIKQPKTKPNQINKKKKKNKKCIQISNLQLNNIHPSNINQLSKPSISILLFLLFNPSGPTITTSSCLTFEDSFESPVWKFIN